MSKNWNQEESVPNGYDALLMSYAVALEDNSEEIAQMLEALSEKNLSERDKKQLRRINKELDRINKSLDCIGG